MTSRSNCWTLFLALTLLVQSARAAASQSAIEALNSTDDMKIGPSILAVVAIAAGLFLLVAGYRMFRIAVFLCGFILGGIGIASFIEWIFVNRTWMDTASWIGFFAGGLLVGLIASSSYSMSLFVAGATGGVMLGFAIHASFAYRIWENHPNIVLLVLVVGLGIICGVLALKLDKPMIIISTSFVGAMSVIWGIGYFAGNFPNGASLVKALIFSVPDAWYAYLAGVIVLFVFGMFIQFRKTGRGNRHHHVMGLLRRNRAVPPSNDTSNDAYGNAQTPPPTGNFGDPVSRV